MPSVTYSYSIIKNINLEYVKDFYIDIQGLDMKCTGGPALFGSGKAFFVFYSNGVCVSISETRASAMVKFDENNKIIGYADAFLSSNIEQFYALIEKIFIR